MTILPTKAGKTLFPATSSTYMQQIRFAGATRILRVHANVSCRVPLFLREVALYLWWSRLLFFRTRF